LVIELLSISGGIEKMQFKSHFVCSLNHRGLFYKGGIFLAFILVGALLLMTNTVVQAQQINRIYCTDVRDGSFVVTWSTDIATDAHVDWGTTIALGNTTSDLVASTTTHLVTISGLTPSTTYFFQARSGATVDDNGGSFYTCTTGPNLGIPSPGRTVFGQFLASDGITPLENAIVYLSLEDAGSGGSPGQSQLVTARTDTNGFWFFNLNDIRTATATAYFAMTDGVDQLRIIGQGGSAGTYEAINCTYNGLFVLPLAYPEQFDIEINCAPTAVSLAQIQVQSANSLINWALILIVILLTVSVVLIRRHRAS
jgi:hypothetical protein